MLSQTPLKRKTPRGTARSAGLLFPLFYADSVPPTLPLHSRCLIEFGLDPLAVHILALICFHPFPTHGE